MMIPFSTVSPKWLKNIAEIANHFNELPVKNISNFSLTTENSFDLAPNPFHANILNVTKKLSHRNTFGTLFYPISGLPTASLFSHHETTT
jgi:hypothetical protein